MNDNWKFWGAAFSFVSKWHPLTIHLYRRLCTKYDPQPQPHGCRCHLGTVLVNSMTTSFLPHCRASQTDVLCVCVRLSNVEWGGGWGERGGGVYPVIVIHFHQHPSNKRQVLWINLTTWYHNTEMFHPEPIAYHTHARLETYRNVEM